MSMQALKFRCCGTPDDTAVKAQLSSIQGVTEMNIDSKSHAVDVYYDAHRASQHQIETCLAALDYQVQH